MNNLSMYRVGKKNKKAKSETIMSEMSDPYCLLFSVAFVKKYD